MDEESAASSGPLDASVRAEMTAVVFDANAFGRGRPNVRLLHQTAERLAKAGLEVWVPEPVAWEWAEHLVSDVAAYRVQAKSARRALDRCLLDTGSFHIPYDDSESLVDSFLDVLSRSPHVRILPLTGESARRALRDQILQLGPGSRVKDVKTGGSDSAWLRDVLTEVNGDFAKVLIVTENRKDVYAFCKEGGIKPPAMRPLVKLPEALFSFVADTGHLSALIVKFFQSRIQDPEWDQHDGPLADPDIYLGPVSNMREFSSRLPGEVQVNDFTIRRISQLLSVSEVAIEDPTVYGSSTGTDTSGVTTAMVRLLADVDISTYRINSDGEVQPDTEFLHDVEIVSFLVLQFEDGVVVSAYSAGETRAYT